MSNDVRIRASVDDKVSGNLDRIRDKFDTVGKSAGFKSLVQGVGLGVGAAAFNVLGGAVNAVVGQFGEMQAAYREDQASQAKLRASLFANVGAFQGNTKAIEGVLESRMRLGFSDDEQRDSLASLVTRTKDHIKALELQRLAMDLARLRGLSLSAASDLIGKAFDGQVGALRRAGIAVDKNATATQALAAVQKAAAGQAEAYADTSEGKLAASQVRAGEVMERFGKVIDRIVQQVLPPLVGGLEAVADAFESMGIGVDKTMEDVKDAADRGSQSAQARLAAMAYDMGLSVEEMVAKSRAAARESAAAIKEGDAAFRAVSQDFTEALPDEMDDARREAIRIANRTPQDIADALREERGEWQDAVEQLKDDFTNRMSRTTEIARIKGALTGEELRKGLKSKDPVLRAQANATRQILLDRLIAMGGDARKYGQSFTENLAKGILDRIQALQKALRLLAKTQADYLQYQSPAKVGPGSEGGGPEGWARKFVESYVKGMDPAKVASASTRIAAASMPRGLSRAPGSSGGLAMSDAPSSGGPITVVLQVDGREVARAMFDRSGRPTLTPA